MKRITKLVFGVVATFVVSLTFASDNLTVINQSPKASVMTGLATTVQDTIGNNTSFYQSRDCKDAARAYTQKKNQVIIYETMNVASAAAGPSSVAPIAPTPPKLMPISSLILSAISSCFAGSAKLVRLK